MVGGWAPSHATTQTLNEHATQPATHLTTTYIEFSYNVGQKPEHRIIKGVLFGFGRDLRGSCRRSGHARHQTLSDVTPQKTNVGAWSAPGTSVLINKNGM